MCQSVHHKKDFTVVSMRVYGSFSNCHWSKHQDFVKVAARSQNGNEAARRRQDHERGEQGPRPLGAVSAEVKKSNERNFAFVLVPPTRARARAWGSANFCAHHTARTREGMG